MHESKTHVYRGEGKKKFEISNSMKLYNIRELRESFLRYRHQEKGWYKEILGVNFNEKQNKVPKTFLIYCVF